MSVTGRGIKVVSRTPHTHHLSLMFNVHAMTSRATLVRQDSFPNISLKNIHTSSDPEPILVPWNRTIYNCFLPPLQMIACFSIHKSARRRKCTFWRLSSRNMTCRHSGNLTSEPDLRPNLSSAFLRPQPSSES